MGKVGLTVKDNQELLFDGLWYFLFSYSVLKSNQLPKLLIYLGFAMGILSLVHQLEIFVLVLSVVWSVWLGQLLLKNSLVSSQVNTILSKLSNFK